MNKKAMFFSLMAMLLISLFIFALTNPPANVISYERIESTSTRVQSLNHLVSSINSLYIKTILETITYKTLQDIAQGNIPISGSIYETVKLELENSSSSENSVYYWFDKLTESAQEAYHTDLVLDSFSLVSVTQQDNEPFSVSVEYNIDYSVNKENPNLFWQVDKELQVVKVNIFNLIDPDNSNQPIYPDSLGGLYSADSTGKSYLEKIGGDTLYESTRLCPSTASSYCGNP